MVVSQYRNFQYLFAVTGGRPSVGGFQTVAFATWPIKGANIPY
jgi:hypothetical protein